MADDNRGYLSLYAEENPNINHLPPDQIAAHMYEQGFQEKIDWKEFLNYVGYDNYIDERYPIEQASPMDILKAGWSGIQAAATDTIPLTLGRMWRNGEVSLRDDDIVDRFITEQVGDLEEGSVPLHLQRKTIAPFLPDAINLGALQRGLSQLGYSAAVAGPGIVAGSLSSGPVGASLGAGASSLASAYRASKDEYVSTMRDAFLSKNPNMSEDEWNVIRSNIEEDAQLYGAWEAAPEAVSNALTIGLINVPLSKIAENIPFIKKGIARSMLAAVGKAGAALTEENLQEVITEMKQSEILAKNGFLEKPKSFSEALRDVYPETSVMTLAMMGAGSGIRKMVTKPKDLAPPPLDDSLSKELEVSKDDDLTRFELESTAFNKRNAGINLSEDEQKAIEETTERVKRTRRAQELESDRAVFEREFSAEPTVEEPTVATPIESQVEERGRPTSAEESFRVFEEAGLAEPVPQVKSAERSARVFLEQARPDLSTEEVQSAIEELSLVDEYQDPYTDRAIVFGTEEEANSFIQDNQLEKIYDTVKDPDTNLFVVKDQTLHLATLKKRGEQAEDTFAPLSKYIDILSGEEGQIAPGGIVPKNRTGLRPIIQREIEGLKQRFPTLTRVLLNQRGAVGDYTPDTFQEEQLDIQDQKIGDKVFATLLTPNSGPLRGYTIAVEPPPTNKKIATALADKAQEVIDKNQPTGGVLVTLKRFINKMKKINESLGEVGAVGSDVNARVFKDTKASQKRSAKLQEKLNTISPDRKKKILAASKLVEDGKEHRAKQNIEVNKNNKELLTHLSNIEQLPSKKTIPTYYRKLKSWSLVPLRLFDEIDDFKDFKGMFVKAFYNPVQKAVTKTLQFVHKRKDAIISSMKKYDISVHDLIEKQTPINGHTFTKQQMMYIYLGKNNPYTKYIMEKNMAITDDVISKVDKALSQKEKDFATELQKDLEQAYGRIAEVLSNNFRYIINDGSLSKSDIRLLKSVYDTKGQKYKVFNKVKNYLPMWVKQADVAINPDNMADELSGYTLVPEEKEGHIAKTFVYERKRDHDYAIDLNLFNIWERAVNMQEHFINLAEPMKIMEDTYNKNISKNVGMKFGGSYNKAILSYFNRVKNPNFYRSNRGLDKLNRGIRRNIALAYLGYNVVTGLKQVPSILYYLPYTNLPYLSKAIIDTIANPKATLQLAREDSQMRDRILDRYLAELSENEFESGWDTQLAARLGKRGTQARSFVVKHAMDLIRAMDTLATSIGYKAVFDYEMSKGNVTEEEARNRALLATVNTQPAAHPKDIPQLYAYNEWFNYFLMFSNQLNKLWNMGVHTVFDQTVATKQIKRDQVYTMASMAIGATLIWSISNGLRTPDDMEEVGEALFEGAANSVPVIGRVISQAWLGYPYEIPLFTVPTNVAEGLKKTFENGGVPTKEEWNKFAEATALTLGLPYTSTKRLYKAVESNDLRLFLGAKLSSKPERELTNLKKDIVKWKEKNTPEGKIKDLRPVAQQVIEMEKLGEDKIARHLSNKLFAMARKEGVNPYKISKLLMDLRKRSTKELDNILSNTDWASYLSSLDQKQREHVEDMREYVRLINKHYYEVDNE